MSEAARKCTHLHAEGAQHDGVVCCKHGNRCKYAEPSSEQSGSPAHASAKNLNVTGTVRIGRTDDSSVNVVGRQDRACCSRNASPPSSTYCRTLHEDASTAIVRPRRSSKSQVCYMGLLTKEQAEKACKKRTEFRLYHRLPSDAPGIHQLRSALTLTIVYRTSAGNYCHYPIRQNGYASDEVGYRVRVDYGDPASPEFTSITQLIRYYTLFFHKNPDASCGVELDVFPWWTAA